MSLWVHEGKAIERNVVVYGFLLLLFNGKFKVFRGLFHLFHGERVLYKIEWRKTCQSVISVHVVLGIELGVLGAKCSAC